MKQLWLGVAAVLAVASVALAGPLPKDVDAYVKTLKTDKDAAKRIAAIGKLRDVVDVKVSLVKPAIPALLAALKDPDVGVRRNAASLLGYVEGDPKEIVPALIELLEEKQPRDAKVGAATGLAPFGKAAREALPLLVEIQKAENDKAEDKRDRELLDRVNEAVQSLRAN